MSIQCTKAHTDIFRPLDHLETPLFFPDAFISIFLIRCLSLASISRPSLNLCPLISPPPPSLFSHLHLRLTLSSVPPDTDPSFPPLGLCQAGLSFGIWPCGTYSHICFWVRVCAREVTFMRGEGGSSGYSTIYIKPILCSWKTAVMIVINGY